MNMFAIVPLLAAAGWLSDFINGSPLFTAVTPLLAASMPGGIAGLAVWIIIVAAVVAVVFVACKAMGVAIPAWAVQVLWIIVIAAVCIWAVKFLMAL